MLQQDADHKLEYNLYRILSGYYLIDYKDKTYKIVYPSLEIKYDAERLYHKILEDNKFETSWMNSSQLQTILNKNNVWNQDKEKQLADYMKSLDSAKMSLYKEFMNQKMKNIHKKTISNLNKHINKLNLEKTSLDYLTLDHFASTVKNEFIIMNCIYLNDSKVFNDNILDSNQYQFVQNMSRITLENQISGTELRKISRSELWRSYYNEYYTFFKSSLEQNDDQRHLISLTKMYDSVRQHPETPVEEVLEDDDALDGWFLMQKEKSQKEKSKNQILDKIGGIKRKDAGEIFVMTQDEQEANAVWNMNDAKALKEIEAVRNAKPNTKWTDLEHVIENKLAEQGKAGYSKVGT